MPVTEVLYQDKDLVVCRKAPGLLSEGEGPDSLVTLLSRQCGGPVYPVHRLDRGAAGLMVFARSQTSAATRSRAVPGKRLSKEYFALVSGVPAAWPALLAGVTRGGRGPPVASLASLVSLRLYLAEPGARAGRYLAVFTAVNALGLLALLAVSALVL